MLKIKKKDRGDEEELGEKRQKADRRRRNG